MESFGLYKRLRHGFRIRTDHPTAPSSCFFTLKSTLFTMNYDLWDYDNNTAQIHFTGNPD